MCALLSSLRLLFEALLHLPEQAGTVDQLHLAAPIRRLAIETSQM
jgi:hypothetical protein